jgi:hypothetical protein
MPLIIGVISSSLQQSGATFDTDAQTFFTALESDASPTTLSNGQKNTVNTFVQAAKAHGYWSKLYAIYPIVGGTASAHKYNLKDPRDLDAAYRLTFNSTPTHSATGIAWSGGTNAFADTHLVPSSALTLNSTSLTYYSRTQVLADEVEIGVLNGTGDLFLSAYQNTTSGTRSAINSSTKYNSSTSSVTRGFFTANRVDASNVAVYRSGIQLASQAVASTSLITGFTIYLGAANNSGSVSSPSSKECAFASIGSGLTPTEITDFNNDIQTYQTSLGRNITPTVPDAPTIGTASSGNTAASVTFTPPANDGNSSIIRYVVTSTPSSITATGTTSPINVTGLTNGSAYTFTVHATNAIGDSAESAASNSVTPTGPTTLFLDTFTGTDTVNGLSGHTPDIATGNYSVAGIPLGISGNRAYMDTSHVGQSAGLITHSNNSGSANGTFTCDITLATTAQHTDRAMFIRANNAQNALQLTLTDDATASKYNLYKVVSGTYTLLTGVTYGTRLNPAQTYSIKAVCLGTQIDCYLDNVLQFSYNQSTPYDTAKGIGLQVFSGPDNGTGYWDNLKQTT